MPKARGVAIVIAVVATAFTSAVVAVPTATARSDAPGSSAKVAHAASVERAHQALPRRDCFPTGASCRSATWMSRTFRRSPDITLSQMILPGTHDSGAYGIRTSAPCSKTLAHGASGALRPLIALRPCVIADLLRAQQLTIGEQLEIGVRYFDLRIGVPRDQVPPQMPSAMAEDPASLPIMLTHQLVAQPLVEALDDITRFVDRHPREQIILDFQQVTFPPALDAYYRDALHRLLQRHSPRGAKPICRVAWTRAAIPVADSRLATDVRLRDAWDARVSVIAYFLAKDMPAADDCYRQRWAAASFLWPDTASVRESREANVRYLEDRRDRLASGDCVDANKNDWCGLFVSQMQLTPRFLTFGGCTVIPTRGCSLRHLAVETNAGLVSDVERWRFELGLPVNVVMVDWVGADESDVVEGLIRLNQRVAARAS